MNSDHDGPRPRLVNFPGPVDSQIDLTKSRGLWPMYQLYTCYKPYLTHPWKGNLKKSLSSYKSTARNKGQVTKFKFAWIEVIDYLGRWVFSILMCGHDGVALIVRTRNLKASRGFLPYHYLRYCHRSRRLIA